MGRHFKIKLFRIIPLFKSCRSKDSSKLVVNPIHSQVSCRILSVGFGCGSKPEERNEIGTEFRWKKEEKWHVIAKVHDEITNNPRRKIYNSSFSGVFDREIAEFQVTSMKKKKNPKSEQRKQRLVRFSNSSWDRGWFSSDGTGEEDNEETETLVSSSSEILESNLETIHELPIQRKKKLKRISRRVKRYKQGISNNRGEMVKYPRSETESPKLMMKIEREVKENIKYPRSETESTAKLTMMIEGKVEESYAVVKKSEDPYEDFRMSMMEMILEKEMFEARDLEQLLHCFLSLNSRHHHQIIVQVFSEIWEFLFSSSSLANF